MTRRLNMPTAYHPKTLLIPVYSPYNPARDQAAYSEEFINLVESNNVSFDAVHEMKIRSIDHATFFTKGKLEEIVSLCAQNSFEEVIISESLTIQQERNLSKLLRARIFDRTQLILEIFEKRAASAEGKLQIKLARLQYQKSRLAGRGIHFSQQGGSIGTRGPGETQKEKDLQHIEHLMLKIRRDLKKLEAARATQRKRRINRQEPLICLVGYTNAGKSTLLNLLTQSDTLVENRLFSTLDTTTRELYIHGKKIGLLSDTVGFIQQLPHHLIEAFKSTLHELAFAHLIIHVVDIHDPNWQSHIATVQQILAELEIDKPIIYVLNKADLLTPEAAAQLHPYIDKFSPAFFTSALNHAGVSKLQDFLSTWNKDAQTFAPA